VPAQLRGDRSFRLDAGVLDHLRRFGELRLDGFAEFLGRAGKRFEPDIGDLPLHLGVVDDPAQLGIKAGEISFRVPAGTKNPAQESSITMKSRGLIGSARGSCGSCNCGIAPT